MDPWREERSDRRDEPDAGSATQAHPPPRYEMPYPRPQQPPSAPRAPEPRPEPEVDLRRPAPARTPAPSPGGARAPVQVRRLRRGRLAIRKIDPWAVLKFSLVFYFCMLLIMLLGTAIIFAVLKLFGVVDNLEQLLRDLEFDVTIAGGTIFRWFFLIGLVGTVIASAITVFMAFLYNLIADVVGGIELLVTERE